MRVLLAENNLSNRLVARSVLERDKHDVAIVTNGADAVARIQSEPFDVVLLDIVMPVMDGFQTVRYLNDTASRPDFIFALSAYDTADDFNLYRKAGFDGMIAKPLRRGDLSAALKAGRPGLATTTGFAANAQDADCRPLLDEAFILEGPGQADELTRQRVWRSYRTGLSASLKEISRSLPGYVAMNEADRIAFRDALHALRSTSLTVGMDRAPYLARQLRNAPPDQITSGLAALLRTLRATLPVLETALDKLPSVSVVPR